MPWCLKGVFATCHRSLTLGTTNFILAIELMAPHPWLLARSHRAWRSTVGSSHTAGSSRLLHGNPLHWLLRGGSGRWVPRRSCCLYCRLHQQWRWGGGGVHVLLEGVHVMLNTGGTREACTRKCKLAIREQSHTLTHLHHNLLHCSSSLLRRNDTWHCRGRCRCGLLCRVLREGGGCEGRARVRGIF